MFQLSSINSQSDDELRASSIIIICVKVNMERMFAFQITWVHVNYPSEIV